MQFMGLSDLRVLELYDNQLTGIIPFDCLSQGLSLRIRLRCPNRYPVLPFHVSLEFLVCFRVRISLFFFLFFAFFPFFPRDFEGSVEKKNKIPVFWWCSLPFVPKKNKERKDRVEI